MPLTLGEYYVSILNLILIAIVGALGLNVLVGYTGQISIGHGAFMSVGAYTAANLANRLGSPWPVNLLAGGLMAATVHGPYCTAKHGLVGLSKGMDMIINATTLPPAQAIEAGLVDRLFPDAAACREGAMEYATKIASGPSVALGHAKLAITQGYGAPLDLGLALEREAISRVFVSQDANEGIKAFGEKRKANFKGQ